MKEVLITRTVKTTTGKVRGLRKGKVESESIDYSLPGELKEKEAFKALSKQYEDSDFIPAYIETITVEETLYGMALNDFINSPHVKKLPPRESATQE